MTNVISKYISVIIIIGLLQVTGQTAHLTISRNGYVSGEHAVFSFDGKLLAIRYGSDRSGLGFATDLYSFANGAWLPVPARSHSRVRPIVQLGQCDPGDTIDISTRFPEYLHSLPDGSKLKYVGTLTDRQHSVLVIYSQQIPNTQIGGILRISLLRDGQPPVVIASADIGESRYCSAQWNEHDDGTRNLIVFTLEPAASSVSYAFQSFTVH